MAFNCPYCRSSDTQKLSLAEDRDKLLKDAGVPANGCGFFSIMAGLICVVVFLCGLVIGGGGTNKQTTSNYCYNYKYDGCNLFPMQRGRLENTNRVSTILLEAEHKEC